MKHAILVFLIAFMQFICKGQDLVFNHLMMEDGLSQNSILAIAQDSKGLMWYGTRYGLNSYDGSKFHLYKSKPKDTTSLSGDYITTLYNDPKGTLWVGTTNGLNKFNPRKGTFERKLLDQTRPELSHVVRAITEDKKGNLWVGTNYGLYVLISRQSHLFFRAEQLGLDQGIAKNEIQSLYEDHQGFLWIGSNHGLVKTTFENRFKTVKTFTRDQHNPLSISDNSVSSIIEDHQNNLWIGTERSGLNLFHQETQSFSRFSHQSENNNSLTHNAIRTINVSKTGELWIGTQEGLSVLNPITKKFSNYKHSKSNLRSLNQNSIYAIFEDFNNSMWIGTYYGGVNVNYASPTPFKIWQYNEKQSGLNFNVISSINEGKNGTLWIGTEGGGLNYYQPDNRQFGSYTYNANDSNSLGSNLVKIVYKDRSDDIWIGTHGGGLNLFNPATKKFKRFFSQKGDLSATRSEIIAILEDNTGVFWIGSQTGLSFFKKQADRPLSYPMPEKLNFLKNQKIRFLLDDSENRIWVATTSGLYIYSPKKGSLQTLKLPKTATGADYINCLYEDANKNIWIGLYHGGLLSYNLNTQAFTNVYSVKDGLSNDNVVGILEDHQGHIWISTSNGLSKLDPVSKKFQTYTTSDGISGDEFNYNSSFKSKTGALMFGGYNGLTYFFPNEIQQNRFQAPIIFTGLLLFNNTVAINGPDQLLQQDISYTKKLIFKHSQNIFTLQFALLSYIKSKKNKYAYKLEGINKQWIETNTPSASYTNLPSGSYTLLIKGTNNDGVWSIPQSIQIEILPPFWKTWWAFSIYAILLATVIFFITRFFYLRELLIKDEELHQNKLNFFTNVSHEIRTHLTLIMVPIDKLIDSNKEQTENQTQLNKVKNNANRLLKLVSELMDFRKAETKHLKLHIAPHNLVDFVRNICSTFEGLSVKKEIHLSILCDQDVVMVYFDKEQLEKVFFNLITNAFKFTPRDGHITVRMITHKDSVTVSVEDTGRGIAPEHLDLLFSNYFQIDDQSIQNTGYGIGLALSKNIVELHRGSISVISKPSDGQETGNTSFTVTMLRGIGHLANKYNINSATIPQLEPTANHIEEPTIIVEESHDHSRKTATILIVEDHKELRQLIKESLENDYKILLAEDGLNGWQKATEEIPDLVISDVMMPHMDGFTLCGNLKSDERTRHIPIVLLTAKESETDQITGLTGGADIYLTKPFSSKILQLNVRNLLNSREIMRQKFGKSFLLEPRNVEIDSADEQFLTKLILIIEDNMDHEKLGIDFLSEKIGMSSSVLYKKLKAITNLSINEFSKSIRLKRAAQLLKQKQFTIYEVGYMIGFTDRKYFSREFKKQFGKTPTEYMDE